MCYHVFVCVVCRYACMFSIHIQARGQAQGHPQEWHPPHLRQNCSLAGDHQLGYSGWLESSRDPPICSSQC